MSAFRIVTRGAAFLRIVILARVLSPSQFGIFGIATLVLSLLELLTETGINVFIIQTKHNLADYVDSAWVVSIIRGVIIFALIVISSAFVSKFFNTPESFSILLLISLVPLLRGFINPAEIKFQKQLQFNYEFWFRSGLFLFDAGVSIIFALLTHSVYSLVIGMLAGVLLEVLLSFVLIKPTPRFAIHKGYFSEIFHSGKWVTIYGVFQYFAEQGDNIVVGRILGSGALGIYEMAYNISILPISEITDVVNRVTFPVYARINQDRKRLSQALIKTTAFIALTTILLGIIIFLFPKEIIMLFLGQRWLSAVAVLRILAIYGVLRAISGSLSSLFLGVEKQKYVTAMLFTRFIGLAITIYPLVLLYGLVGAGYSALFSVLIEIPVILYCLYFVFNKRG